MGVGRRVKDESNKLYVRRKTRRGDGKDESNKVYVRGKTRGGGWKKMKVAKSTKRKTSKN